MAFEFQGLTRPRGTAPATLFDPLAYVSDPAPVPSGGLASSAVSAPIQTEVLDRPTPAATPISHRHTRRFAAAGAAALAAAGWAAWVLWIASPPTGAAPLDAAGSSALTSPVREFPSPGVASGTDASARDEDLTASAPAAPAAHPSQATVDTTTPAAAAGTPDTRNTQTVKRAISLRKPPAVVTPPPPSARDGADQWSAAFGPDGRFWAPFRSEHTWHR